MKIPLEECIQLMVREKKVRLESVLCARKDGFPEKV